MTLTVNVVIFVVLCSGFLLHNTDTIPETIIPFIALCTVFLSFMGLSQLMFNHFGFDRNGFRALVLSPASRRNILFGKNLALLPAACILFAVFLGLVMALLHLRTSAVLAAVLGFCGGFPLFSILGNFISIAMPYRVEPGTLRSTKIRAGTQLMIFVIQLLFPLALLPVAVPVGLGWMCDHFGRLPGTAVSLASGVILFPISALIYFKTLKPLGNLLQRRGSTILQVVTEEVE